MLPEPVDYSMDQVNGPPVWRTSISSHLTPNIANIVRKFAPSIFLCVATERRLNSEKKKGTEDRIGSHWSSTLWD